MVAHFPYGEGEVNEQGVTFYSNLIDELLKHDIEPIVTIYHWDLPQALQDAYGGWESREIIRDFTDYATLLFDRFSDRVKYWVSINEQNVFVMHGYMMGSHPPGVQDPVRALQVNHIVNLANASVMKAFRSGGYPGMIGPSFAYSPSYALNNSAGAVIANENAMSLMADFWMDVYVWGRYPKAVLKQMLKMGINIDMQPGDDDLLAWGKPDFMGVNYYQSTTVDAMSFTEKVESSEPNYSGEKGTSGEWGCRVFLKQSKMKHWKLQTGIGRLTHKVYELDCVASQVAMICQR
nr:family 1 glycosylhydrolase [Erysipelothrix sp. HDW6C]